MSKFHSIVSRREFMKGLGLAGAGLGAAATVSPAFNDLDDLMSSGSNADKRFRPWWIKELDHEKTTIEIDWQLSHRADRTKLFEAEQNGSNLPIALDTRASKPRLQNEYVKQKYPEWQGNTVRDFALYSAGNALAFYNFHAYGGYRGYDAATHKSSAYTGLETAALPETNGFSKWQGTPEENLNMVRAACRTFGCEEVGVVEITENTRKLINLNSTSGKPNNFKDVEKGSDSKTETVIPNKAKYMIVYTNVQPTYLTQRCPAQVGLTANTLSYQRMPVQRVQLQEFLRGLGYQGLQVDGMCQSDPFGALGGFGEHSRSAMVLTSPFFGNMYRGIQRMLTDLPLAPTKPIDAGIAKFCLSCMKCADNCPYQALPHGEPSWEHEDTQNETVIDGHVYKGWRLYNLKCPRCQNCQASCVFSKYPAAGVHDVVKALVSTTSVFNGFFRNMDDMLGYGFKEPESWWSMEEQPVWGVEPKLWTS